MPIVIAAFLVLFAFPPLPPNAIKTSSPMPPESLPQSTPAPLPNPDPVRPYIRGIYQLDFNKSSFTPCDRREQWLVIIEPDDWHLSNDIRAGVGKALGRDDFNLWKQVILMEASGDLSATGRLLEGGRYDRTFTLKAVRNVGIASADDIQACGATVRRKKSGLF